jgi:hypothetical protein
MAGKTRIAFCVAIVSSAASVTLAAPVHEASNKSPQYSSPDSTPNGPFYHVDTYGVPPKGLQPAHQPRRAPRKH